MRKRNKLKNANNKAEIIALQTEQAVIKKSSSANIIHPFSGLINDINEYSNSLVSYKYDSFTHDMASLIYANPHVQAKLSLKLNKALAYKKAFNYDGVTKTVGKYIKDVFVKEFKWRDFAKQIAFNKVYGKSVVRVFWDGDKITKTVGVDYRFFTFNTDYAKGDIGDLMYNEINLTKNYPYNFMVFFNEPNTDNPFGVSSLKSLYPTIMFYNFLSKVEARYFNKAVIPSFVAGYDSDAKGDEREEESNFISGILSNIENGAGVAIANLKQLFTLAENGQVNFNSTFERLINTISITILGSDMTDSKKNGTYAQADAATQYIDGNIKDLAVEIQGGENDITKWQTWAKFGTDYTAPQSVYDMQEPYSLEVFKFMVDNNLPISFTEASKVLALPIGMQCPADDILRPMDDLYQKIKTMAKITTNSGDKDSKKDDGETDDN
jgi:hypothetical protein